MLGAVEAHMLQKVGKSFLTIQLIDRAHALCYKEIGLSGRCIVLLYVVSEAVGQCAGAHCRIQRYRVGRRCGECRCQKKCGCEKFHIAI